MKDYAPQDEINTAMDRLRAVRDDLGQRLAEQSCETSDMKRLSELHKRLSCAISAYSLGK